MQTSKKSIQFNAREWFLFFGVLLAVHLLSYFTQGHTTVHQGLGWDGRVYFNMALQFFQDETIAARSPFVYRQFTPWLAAMFSNSPNDLLSTFKVINLIFATLTAVVILLTLAPIVPDWRIRVFAASLFPLHFHVPLRFSYFDGNHVTSVAMFAIASTIYLMQKLRTNPYNLQWLALLSAVAFCATLNRSSFLIISALIPLCLPFPKHATTFSAKIRSLFEMRSFFLRLRLLLPMAMALLAYLLVRQDTIVTGYYGEEKSALNQGSTLLYFIYAVYEQPFFWLLEEFFIAYGPLVVVLLWKREVIAKHLSENWHWLLLLLLYLLYAALSSAIRQFLTVMPLYIILIALAMQAGLPILKKHKIILSVLVAAQMISQRIFWTTPHQMPNEPQLIPADAPISTPILFTPFSSDFMFYDIVPYFNRGGFYGPIVIAEYIIFTAIILYLLIAKEEIHNRGSKK